MSKSLPARPSLRQLKIQAKELLHALKSGEPDAVGRFTRATRHAPPPCPKLADAQLVLAREHRFDNWAALKKKAAAAENRPDDALLGRFREAVQGGNVAGMEALLEEHPFLRARVNDPLFSFGGSALLNAVGREDRPMIDALLRAGADLDQKSAWEPGGFGILDRVGDELGEYLIARGAKIDVHAAAHLGKMDRLRALLDENPSLVNARGGDGGTPLHFARNAEVADLLLRRGADVTLRDRDHGSTAAMWRIGNREVLHRLIEAGSPIDIFMACVHGDMALARRALREHPGCLDAFVSHGKADSPFARGTGGNIYNWELGHAVRPIPVAAKRGHRELTDFLLGEASDGQRLLSLCLIGDREAVERLLRARPDLAATLEEDKARALPDAIHFRDREGARLMLDAGFPTTAKGVDGADALHLAAWHGDAEFVRRLIERGAVPGVWHEDGAFLRRLRDRGAILGNRDNDHASTPLEAACHGSLHCWDRTQGDYRETIALLVRAGADAGKESAWKKEGRTGWASPEAIAAIP